MRDEGGFTGLKLRLGRDRASDDLAAIHTVRAAVGDDVELMADFNQGLHLGEALQRCHMIDDEGLAWIEEPIVYDNLDGYVQLGADAVYAALDPSGSGSVSKQDFVSTMSSLMVSLRAEGAGQSSSQSSASISASLQSLNRIDPTSVSPNSAPGTLFNYTA